MSLKNLWQTNRTWWFFFVGWGALQLVVGSVWLGFVLSHEGSIRSFSLAVTLLGWAGLTVVFCLGLMPATYLALIGGYFGGFISLGWLLPIYILAVSIGYYVGQKIDGGNWLKSIEAFPKVKKLLDRLHHQHFYIVFLSRLSPNLPFQMLNLVLSAAKVPFSSYLWGSVAGALPRTVLTVWAGANAQSWWQLWQEQNSTNQILSAVFVFSSFGGLWFIFKRAVGKETPPENTPPIK